MPQTLLCGTLPEHQKNDEAAIEEWLKIAPVQRGKRGVSRRRENEMESQ